ncbi:MAG: uroporphyrinogen-III C-methyltransferase [Nitriliruptor sp.]
MTRLDLPFGGLGGPPARGGVIHIVGGGPGDPGYLTLRAATLLSTCDVVAYDHLSPAEALSLVPAHADRILVGRRAGAPSYSREEVDELLLARAAAGQAVVRLKGGDPFVFGRGGEEGSSCADAGVAFEVIPGVTSPVAVPGAAGIPVTHRTVSPGFMVVTGHEVSDDEPLVDHVGLARFPGTVVLLMGRSRLRTLADALIAHGRDPETPAAVISSGTLPAQRSVEGTLATIADAADAAELEPPAVIVVGDVVAMREQLGWRERRVLQGVRVLLPRSSQRPSRVAVELRHAGAAVFEVPVAREVEGDSAALARLAVEIRDGLVGTLIATDVRGIRRLLDALSQVGADVRSLAGTQLWSVGSRTGARLRSELGLRPDADLASATELLAAATPPEHPVVVLGAQDEARAVAAPLGGRAVVSSRTVPSPGVAVPEVDVVVLPASGLVEPTVEALDDRDDPIVAMGPATAAAVRAQGRSVAAEASEPTGGAVVEAVVAALGERRDRPTPASVGPRGARGGRDAAACC